MGWGPIAIKEMLTALRAAADGVLAVLLAPCCAACRRPLESPTGGPVCATCWRAILPITPPVCDACGDPLPSWRQTSIELAALPAMQAPPGRHRSGTGGRGVRRHVARDPSCVQIRRTTHAWPRLWRASWPRPGMSSSPPPTLVVPVPLHPQAGAIARVQPGAGPRARSGMPDGGCADADTRHAEPDGPAGRAASRQRAGRVCRPAAVARSDRRPRRGARRRRQHDGGDAGGVRARVEGRRRAGVRALTAARVVTRRP